MHHLRVGFVQLILTHKVNVLFFQRCNHLVEGVVVLLPKPIDARLHLRKRFCDGESKGGLGVAVHHQHTLQVGHPHPVEFIQVVGVNAQKPHALNQRRAHPLGFLQNALIERQPTQLTVDQSMRCEAV